MFKFAALAAVSATTMDEINHSVEMWKYTVHEKELHGLKEHADALEHESMKYSHQLEQSKHGELFQHQFKTLVETDEFVALAKYVEAVHKKGPTPQIKAFKAKYVQQMHKVKALKMKIDMKAEKTAKLTGEAPDRSMTVDVDDDLWYEFNAEYYKLREMEYYAMYKIPEIAGFRKHLTDVRHTDEWEGIQDHFEGITHGEQHQVVVKHQAKLLIEALKTIHMTDKDAKWVDPHYSPVMFDVWHMVYLYFVAVGKGDVEPMLDFIIDGKYDKEFYSKVDPKFGRPEKNLYLF